MTAPPRSSSPIDIARPDDQHHPDQDHQTTAALPAAEEEQRFSLSATQIMASMAAAITAAMVGSKLGVAGTVIGAGLASVISVVGGAVIGHSILLTRKQVKRAVLQVRGGDHPPSDAWQPTDTWKPTHAWDRGDDLAADDRTVVIPAAVIASDLQRSGPERREPRRPSPTRRRLGAGLLVGVAAAGAIFAGSLATVTLVETVKGSPLSGGDSGGLSVLGGSSGTDSDSTMEVPMTTQTEVATVTQTVTSEPTDTAPATSDEPAPTTGTSAPSSTSPTSSSSAPSSSAPSSSVPSSSAPASSSPAVASGSSGATDR